MWTRIGAVIVLLILIGGFIVLWHDGTRDD